MFVSANSADHGLVRLSRYHQYVNVDVATVGGVAMSQSGQQRSGGSVKAASSAKATPVKAAAIKKAAARAAAASTSLENRAVPAGHVRSRGVKALLAERQARKH